MIIAFVVAVWAAYFVPLVLRRYDEASKNASVETSGTQARVIARPVAKPTAAVAEPRPSVVEPRPSVVAPPTSVVEPVEATPVAEKVTPPPARTLDRPAARLAARRRRRTLLTLLTATAVVGGLAAAAIIAPFWVAAPVALVVAWLVACRVQVRAERGLSRVRAPKQPKADKKKAASTEDDEEQTIIVSGQFEDINPGRKHEMEDLPLEANALDDQIVIAVPSVSTTGEALWDPLPVTLPTYVTKPRAGRTVRTIDFGQAGAWTSGHIEGEDVELPKRSDDTGDERRAVGH